MPSARLMAGGRPRRLAGGLRRRAGLLPELLVEDLPDEAVDGDRVEADVGGADHPGVDDLALAQLVEDALEVGLGVALLTLDAEVLALEEDPGRVLEAEHAGDQSPVHHLALAE